MAITVQGPLMRQVTGVVTEDVCGTGYFECGGSSLIRGGSRGSHVHENARSDWPAHPGTQADTSAVLLRAGDRREPQANGSSPCAPELQFATKRGECKDTTFDCREPRFLLMTRKTAKPVCFILAHRLRNPSSAKENMAETDMSHMI